MDSFGSLVKIGGISADGVGGTGNANWASRLGTTGRVGAQVGAITLVIGNEVLELVDRVVGVAQAVFCKSCLRRTF